MKRTVIALATAAALAASGVTASLALGGRPNNSGNKVTICHATGSAKNPYVEITPDASGVISGHYAHQDHRDIIPPFDYYDSSGVKHSFPGQNWNAENEAILKNHCKRPGTPATPGTTTTGTTGTTTSTPAASTPTVTVVVTTPGPTTTVRKVSTKRVVIVKKVHVRVAAEKAPRTTG